MNARVAAAVKAFESLRETDQVRAYIEIEAIWKTAQAGKMSMKKPGDGEAGEAMEADCD